MKDHLSKAYQQIDAEVQNLRSALTKHLVELEKALKDASGDVHSKVAERKSQARKLQLDEKLTQLFDEIKYYPSLSKRQDWLSSRLCEIDNPEEEKIDKETRVRFSLNGRVYRFTYLDEGGSTGFDGDDFHHTKLSLKDESGKLLIEINISVEYDYVTVLKPFDVSAFIPGPWIQDFLECNEKFQANKQIRELKQKYESEKVGDLKDKFGLE